MNFESLLFLAEFTTCGLVSRLLLISMEIKVMSTGIGLVQARHRQLQPTVWWANRVLAVSVAACIRILASGASQTELELIFGVLFVSALIVIFVLVLRRSEPKR